MRQQDRFGADMVSVATSLTSALRSLRRRDHIRGRIGMTSPAKRFTARICPISL